MEIKDRILKKAEELFFKFGIRSVTMDEVARELGISKKTIYLHFSDKDAIVHEMTQRFLDNDYEKAKTIYEQSENPIDEMIQAARLAKELLNTVNPVLLFDLQKYHNKAWGTYLEHKKMFVQLVTRNLTEGIEQGLYRSEIDVQVMALFRVETVELGFNQAIYPTRNYSVTKVQYAFLDHFLRGILTPKGLEIYEKYILKLKN